MSNLLKGGMTKLLAQSDLVMGRNHANASKNFFNSNLDSLKAFAPSTGDRNYKQVQVASLGGEGFGDGGGHGVGYLKGKYAQVSGHGKSFVTIDSGASDIEEGLTKDEVGEVIHKHLSEIRYCYESAMMKTPDLEGKLVIHFQIGGAGGVKTAAVKTSTLPDPRLDDCVLRRLVTWKFPTPKGGIDVAVSYPFIFKTLER
ncbi:MAG: AgmX/PglI C-terminal domain-containing protein [Deltaproteobacteria bacterium]|nr:AgmX/PglI C-terminal domain-containing protein [Deltaproteobacteria bacterium]